MAEKKPTFEEAMTRLEEIVAKMESGSYSLEESLSLYEEGAKLMTQCTAMLNKAEQKVTKLQAAYLEKTQSVSAGTMPGGDDTERG